VQAVLPWVIVKVLPPAVMVPVRDEVPVFAATEKLMVPDPEPLDPDVIVIHAALLTAVHRQPSATFRPTLPVPPSAGRDVPAKASEGEHEAENEKVFDGSLAAEPPGP
jgi:hypothetical protein